MAFYIFAVCLLSIGILWCWMQHKNETEWEKQHPRTAFRYCCKTLLFYERSHGNQIEFLDSDGYCYLWYPGNSGICVGRWRADDTFIYFRYGINTYNPITGTIGGSWEPFQFNRWSNSIVEDVDGDVLGLKKRMPFVLTRDPPISSIYDLNMSNRN